MVKVLSWGISLLGLSLLGVSSVTAQNFSNAPIGPGVEDVFQRATFHNSGSFYAITGVSGQFNNIFGWRFLRAQPLFKGSYIDNLFTLDARLVNAIYRDYLQQQTDGPVVRTRDLANPFNSSMLEADSAITPP